MAREVTLVDAGLGNIASVERALIQVGAAVRVTDDADLVARSRMVVFPGQSAFGTATQAIVDGAMGAALRMVVERGDPFLGICLGMQLLFDGSEENGGQEGLHVLPGRCLRFPDGMTENRGAAAPEEVLKPSDARADPAQAQTVRGPDSAPAPLASAAPASAPRIATASDFATGPTAPGTARSPVSTSGGPADRDRPSGAADLGAAAARTQAHADPSRGPAAGPDAGGPDTGSHAASRTTEAYSSSTGFSRPSAPPVSSPPRSSEPGYRPMPSGPVAGSPAPEPRDHAGEDRSGDAGVGAAVGEPAVSVDAGPERGAAPPPPAANEPGPSADDWPADAGAVTPSQREPAQTGATVVTPESTALGGTVVTPKAAAPAMLVRRLKVPHMGWNEVEPTGDHYYFVHSYYVEAERSEDVMWMTTYGGVRFPAAVRRQNVMGCQFHPEKSQRAGLKFLRAFLLGGWG